MNRNWRLDTEQGPFALKELLDIDAETARRNLAVLTTLTTDGLPVPTPVRGTAGDLVVEIGDRAFYLLSWIEGSRIPGHALNKSQIESLGALLARLHVRLNEAAVGLPAPEPAPSTPRTVANVDRQITQLQAFIAGQEHHDPFDTLAADTFERRKVLLNAHRESMPTDRLTGVPVGWVHGDFHSSNLLWNADHVSGILDWDRLSARPFGEEVVRAAILHFKSDDGTIDLDRVATFVQAYRSILPIGVDALSDAEHRLWWHHLTSFWILWFHYDRADCNSDHLLGPRENLIQWWTEHRDRVRSAFTTA